MALHCVLILTGKTLRRVGSRVIRLKCHYFIALGDFNWRLGYDCYFWVVRKLLTLTSLLELLLSLASSIPVFCLVPLVVLVLILIIPATVSIVIIPYDALRC